MESSIFSVYSQYSNPMIKGPINGVDVNPLNTRIIIGVTEDSVCFSYDVLEMREQFVFKIAKSAALTDISISKSNCDYFCTSSVDGKVSVLSMKKPLEKPVVYNCNTPVWSASFCSVEPVIAAALDGRIRLFDLRENANLTSLKTGFNENVTVVKWCPHSRHMIACGDSSGRLFLFDSRNPEKNFRFDWNRLETLEDVERPEAHKTTIKAIEFSKDGRNLISCEQNGVVREWCVDDGTSTLNEYRVQPLKRDLRKYDIVNGEIGIFIPENNTVYDIYKEEKMIGHSLDVTGVHEVADGFVSYAQDSICCFWREKSFVDTVEDKSDWSD